MTPIPEPDWRVFRELRVVALERFCERVLVGVDAAARGAGSAHDRYLAVYDILHKSDRLLADTFDAYRRSTALHQLAGMCRQALLEPDELARFSDDTRATVAHLTAR